MTLKIYKNDKLIKKYDGVLSLTFTEAYNIFFRYWTVYGVCDSYVIYKTDYTHFEVVDYNEDPRNEILK